MTIIGQIMGRIFPESAKTPGDGEDRQTHLVALGVLFWAVAEADGTFLDKEKQAIINTLKQYAALTDDELPVLTRAIEEAARERVDLYAFTREVAADLTLDAKQKIVLNLFRVACVDRKLDEAESETIRQVSLLLKVEHKDFIEAKLTAKREQGMDTSGL